MKKTIPGSPIRLTRLARTRKALLRSIELAEERDKKSPRDPCPEMESLKGNSGFPDGNYYTPKRPNPDDL